MPQRSVFCVALSRGRAGRIVLDLKEASFANTEISALFREHRASVGCALTLDASHAEEDLPIYSAAVRFGVMAWIAAVACRVVFCNEPVIAAGPIANALSDAESSSLANELIDFGVPQAKARRYENRIRDGNILVSVHTENCGKSERAREIFSAAGAEDICLITESLSKAVGTSAYSSSGCFN